MYGPYLVLAFVFGLGVLAIYMALTLPMHVEVEAIPEEREETEEEGWLDRLAVKLTQAGMSMPASSFALIMLGLGIGVGLMAYAYSHLPIAGALGFAVGLLLPLAYLEQRLDKARLAFQEALLTAVRFLREELSQQANLDAAMQNVVGDAPEAIAPVLPIFQEAVEARLKSQTPIPQTLAELAQLYRDPFLNALVRIVSVLVD